MEYKGGNIDETMQSASPSKCIAYILNIYFADISIIKYGEWVISKCLFLKQMWKQKHGTINILRISCFEPSRQRSEMQDYWN